MRAAIPLLCWLAVGVAAAAGYAWWNRPMPPSPKTSLRCAACRAQARGERLRLAEFPDRTLCDGHRAEKARR